MALIVIFSLQKMAQMYESFKRKEHSRILLLAQNTYDKK